MQIGDVCNLIQPAVIDRIIAIKTNMLVLVNYLIFKWRRRTRDLIWSLYPSGG